MNWLKKFSVYLKVYSQSAIEYRFMMLIWMFDIFFIPVMLILIWISIIEYSPSLLPQRQTLINFYTLNPLIYMLTDSWHAFFLSRDIRTGKFSTRLLRPIWPFMGTVANNITEKYVKLFFLIPLVFTASVYFNLDLELTPFVLTASVFSLILAAIISFLLESFLGLLAFWTDEVSGIKEIFEIFHLTLGGIMVPIFLFPPRLKSIVQFLPFRYMVSFPTEVLSGSLTSTEIITGMLIVSAWIIFSLFVLVLLWKNGLKQYSSVGG